MLYQTTDEMLATIGAGLRAARLADNISQATAAARSGISLKAVRNLEDGRNASTFSLLALCKTLRLTDWIMNLAPPELSNDLFDRLPGAPPRRRASRVRTGKEEGHA